MCWNGRLSPRLKENDTTMRPLIQLFVQASPGKVKQFDESRTNKTELMMTKQIFFPRGGSRKLMT